jgi:hypothetical protein
MLTAAEADLEPEGRGRPVERLGWMARIDA